MFGFVQAVAGGQAEARDSLRLQGEEAFADPVWRQALPLVEVIRYALG